MIHYSPRILDEVWKATIIEPADFTSYSYGVDTMLQLLNLNYGYHNDKALIQELERGAYDAKKIRERGLPTDEETTRFSALFEKAWAVFSAKVDTKVYSVPAEFRQRIDALDDYLGFLDIQVAGFTKRFPSVPPETMERLRDLKFKFQLPFAEVCNIHVGSEVYNTQLTQAQIPELLSLSEAAREIVEAFVNTIE